MSQETRPLDARQRVKQLLLGIQRDLGRYGELLAMLQRQHLLLATHEVDELTQHNLQQTELMKQIQQQAQHRCQHLGALGLAPDEQGMAKLIARLPDPLRQTMTGQWQQLEASLRQCQQQNDRNGRLLAGQIETLHTLLGQTPEYGQQP